MVAGSPGAEEFSPRTREAALRRLGSEEFDLLVIGGGITGAAAARDAASRGLKVALVEKRDFAWGTSSRSSKLIHGGLRYLQNYELHLVFEALAERTLLLRTAPTLVKPLPFYLPVYRGDKNGKAILDLGLWLYDLLALFRAPGYHKRLSTKKMLEGFPFLAPEGLTGGFQYYDASMWDDVLTVETVRSAHRMGAAVANYVEAVGPHWDGERISGFRVRDTELPPGQGEIDVRAKRLVVCAGPWTDRVGGSLSRDWSRWLKLSKGVHLIFDLKRIPVPGAMVMSNAEDGRIAFVIPRPDFGAGVVIVGTTDGPSPEDPEAAAIEPGDVEYLMKLLHRYFPALELKTSDILGGYVGCRPLMGGEASSAAGDGASVLQKVSREHHIARGPGGAVVVAGGKYTTHRKMGEEIIDFALTEWKRDAREGKAPAAPSKLPRSGTRAPVNSHATEESVVAARARAESRGLEIPEALFSRYGAESLDVVELARSAAGARASDPPGFPQLEAQLRHAIRVEMVMHLEDFYLRRIPLYLTRADRGLPWAERLAAIWAEERGLSSSEAAAELERLRAEIARRSAWLKALAQVGG
jgi:glycerol-3-phosphate dehydrogenase